MVERWWQLAQFLDGNWVDPTLLGALPEGPRNRLCPADFAYP